MATEGLEMHVLREILRQKLVCWGKASPGRWWPRSASTSGKVSSVLARARALGLDAAGVEARSDAEPGGLCCRRRQRGVFFFFFFKKMSCRRRA